MIREINEQIRRLNREHAYSGGIHLTRSKGSMLDQGDKGRTMVVHVHVRREGSLSRIWFSVFCDCDAGEFRVGRNANPFVDYIDDSDVIFKTNDFTGAVYGGTIHVPKPDLEDWRKQ